MKRILITGANSYIGTSFENYIKQWTDKYQVDTVDMVDGTWREKSFEGYDVVIHVAGIVHQKETKENELIYYKVNRDLAIETAQKAKYQGVKQFIFLSTMSVYGMKTGVITKETQPNPKNHYSISKLQAEEQIQQLAGDDYKVCILRPPMVYGKGCKGNFQTVVKLVKISPVFPKIDNERSMLYILNLCAFIKLSIEQGLDGIYFPQNREYMKTSVMADMIAKALNKKIYFSRILGLLIAICRIFFGMLKKAFGNLKYIGTEEFDYCYCIVELEESVRESV